ncbi:hypothetical protein MPH_12974 [Macrophomina phaseolina MS6]|uniref:Uncharacterized protein n=1 Tax=Macrophomina phaseolina (strain MS6) TaxID=1126212 RepID=K2RIM5_MACPH|nr:hypothetical protein MPH_12974 [Macrophomina phaseolina MS6]
MRKIMHIPPIIYTLLDCLSAFDVAKLAAVCKLELTQNDKLRYLHPLRDMGGIEPLLRDAIKDRRKVLLIGTELNLMIDRLTHLLEYVNKFGNDCKVEVAIVMPSAKIFKPQLITRNPIEQRFFWDSDDERERVVVVSTHPSTIEMTQALGLGTTNIDRDARPCVIVELDVPYTGVKIAMEYKETGRDHSIVVCGSKSVSSDVLPTRRRVNTTTIIDINTNPFITETIRSHGGLGDGFDGSRIFLRRDGNYRRGVIIPPRFTGNNLDLTIR